MYLAMRTIHNPTAPVCCQEVFYKEQKCLAVSYGKFITFYVLDEEKLKPIDTIYPGAFVKFILAMKANSFVLVSADNQFVLMKDGYFVKRGKILQVKITSNEDLVEKVAYNEEYAVFTFKNSRISILNYTGTAIKINENLKDLYAYKILDIQIHKNIVICLIEDAEENTYVHRYYIRDENKNFEIKDRKMIKNGKRIAYHDKQLFVFVEGKVLVFKNDDKTVEYVSANPTIICTIPWKNGILAAMDDGEIIHYTENGLKVTNIIELTFDQMVFFNGFIFGMSKIGNSSLFTLIDENIRILDQFENLPCIRNLEFSKGINFLAGSRENDAKCHLKYKIPVNLQKQIECESPVKKFWRYNDKFFVSFIGYSKIADLNKFGDRMDEILNFRNFDKFAILCTTDKIQRLGNNPAEVEASKIQLVDISETHIFVYTESGHLQVFDIANFKLVGSKSMQNEEVSALKIVNNQFIVSTFNDYVKIYNEKLKVINTSIFPTMTFFEQFENNKIIYSTTKGKIGVFDLSTLTNIKLFQCEKITRCTKIGDDLILHGGEAIKVDKNMNCTSFDIKNVQFVTSDDTGVYFCVENTINLMDIAKEPTLTLKKRKLPDEALALCLKSSQKAFSWRNDNSSMVQVEKKSSNKENEENKLQKRTKTENSSESHIEESDEYNRFPLCENVIELESSSKNQVSSRSLIKKHVIKFVNHKILAIKFWKKHMIVISNSEGLEYAPINGTVSLFLGLKRIKKMNLVGEIIAAEVHKGHLLVVHGQLVAVFKIYPDGFHFINSESFLIRPRTIKINGFKIIIADYLRSCAVMEYIPQNEIIDEIYTVYTQMQIIDGTNYQETYIFLHDSTSISTFSKNKPQSYMFMNGTFNFHTQLLEIKQGTLNKQIDDTVFYITTANGAIICMKIFENSKVLSVVQRVIEKLGEKLLFHYSDSKVPNPSKGFTRSDFFLDCDLLVNHPDTERCIEKICKNKDEVMETLKILRNIH